MSVEFGFWIPIVSRIPLSTGKNVPGSGIRISLHGATLGEYLLRLHEYIFQRPTKVHEPVGRVHFDVVFEKFTYTSAYLFQIG